MWNCSASANRLCARWISETLLSNSATRSSSGPNCLLPECQGLLRQRQRFAKLASLEQLGRLTVEGFDLLVRLRNGRAGRNDVADRQRQQDQDYSDKSAHLSIPLCLDPQEARYGAVVATP